MMNLVELAASQNPWWTQPNLRVSLHHPIRQDLQPLLLRRLLHLEDRRALAVVGPRQVGKTVMIRQTLDDLLNAGWPAGNVTYFDFSDHRLTERILPSQVAEIIPPTVRDDYPRALLFDEVSRAKNWDLWLKNVVDRGGFRIAVTDSAASLLRRDATESGQGRWDEYRVEGLTFPEALRFLGEPGESPQQVFNAHPELLEVYLRVGGFPGLLLAPAPVEGDLDLAERLRSDVVDRALYRDLERFGVAVEAVKNLFIYLVQDSGSVFKAAERAADIGHDYRSVQNWVRLLEEAGLLALLPRFAQRPTGRLKGSSTSKVYAADHGLIFALSTPGLQDATVRSRVFEAVVFRHLRELARRHRGHVSYFRRRDRYEVDFVVELRGKRVGVEVTTESQVRRRRIEKSAAALDQLGADLRVLVHGGVERGDHSGIQLIPLPRFLLELEEILSP